MTSTAFWLALIGLLGIGAQWLAWWLRLPAILFLLLTGLLLGPVSGLVDPDQLLGDLLFPFVSLGVAIILFEGGMTLRLHELRGKGSVVTRLVTLGVALTWLTTGAAAWWLLDLDWQVAFLFGALVTVTGPTVIGPLLRTVKPRADLANILRWEGILIDPVGALLAVLVYEFVVSGQQGGHTVWLFCKALLIGGVLGTLAALALTVVFKRHWMPDYLRNVATLALVLMVFTVANGLQHESGLLAVTLMGIVLANQRNLRITELVNFKESLSVLLISLMFIVLAARIRPAELELLGPKAWLILALLMLVIRPLSVWLCAAGAGLNNKDKLFLSWVGPRGIVAAAVSALFALQLEQAGYPQAAVLVPLTFMVIVGTVLLQGLTAKPLARWLQVGEPDADGVLIVGANRVSLALAELLRDLGQRVLIADPDWERVRTARMAGFDTYYGNAMSENADHELDLTGIGRLFAMTHRAELNALICSHYRHVFGSESVYAARTADEAAAPERQRIGVELRGRPLFNADLTLAGLANLLAQGSELGSTLLTEEFDYQRYRQNNGDRVTLFAIDDDGRLQVDTGPDELRPQSGWRLVSIDPTPAAV